MPGGTLAIRRVALATLIAAGVTAPGCPHHVGSDPSRAYQREGESDYCGGGCCYYRRGTALCHPLDPDVEPDPDGYAVCRAPVDRISTTLEPTCISTGGRTGAIVVCPRGGSPVCHGDILRCARHARPRCSLAAATHDSREEIMVSPDPPEPAPAPTPVIPEGYGTPAPPP
jgi:hypothetical protein